MPGPSPRRPSLRRLGIVLATLGCLGLGILSAARLVGPENVVARDGTVPVPIAFDDHALQFYYGALGSRFLDEGGATYGYDPSFMAGYVKMPLYYPSSKPFEFALRLFAGLEPARVFNATLFALFAALPFLMYGAAANLGLAAGERLLVVLLSLAPYQLVPCADFYGFMEASGMIPFVFACFLSVFVSTLFLRFLIRGGRGPALGLLLAAPVLFLSHLMAAVLCAVPLGVLYLWRLRRTPLRRHAWLWLVALAVVALNWSWLEGYLLFSHYGDVSDYYTPAGRSHFVPQGGLLAPLRVAVPAPALFALLPPVFGVVGLAAWWRERRLDRLLLCGPQIAALFLVTYYGADLGLSALSPGRLTLPLGLYLIPPAAHGLAVSAAFLAQRLERLPRRDAALARAAVVAALAGGALLSGLPGKLARRPYSLPSLEAAHATRARASALARWLREHTTSEGRILHEETDRLSHQYYGSHLGALLPLATGREFANGPAPHALLKHNYLRFAAGSLRGRPLVRIPAQELERLFSLYNVRWVLCWSQPCTRYFSGAALAAPAGAYDKFTLYRILTPPSFFLRGAGRIEARPNRLVLRDLVTQEGVVAIKYHWLESLRTDPPRQIEPLYQLDDPVPFIQVQDPPAELVIYQDYGYGLREWLAE